MSFSFWALNLAKIMKIQMKESSTRIDHVINFIDFILVASNTATQVWKVKKEKKKFLENLKKKANEFNIQNFYFMWNMDAPISVDLYLEC